jgi:antitoxin component of MazEF toxin-antitoxin module
MAGIRGVKELKGIIRSIVLEVFPELQGYHYPIRAKVVKVYEKGGKIDEFNNLYSCDVQPLKKDGSVDEESPVIPDIEIPVLWAGNQRGIFCLPKEGTIVRVGFYYNDPAQPFLDAVLPRGYEIPEHLLDSIIIQHSNGIKIEIKPNGEMLLKSSKKITAETATLFEALAPKIKLAGLDHPVAFADVVKTIHDGHTHPFTNAHGATAETKAPSQKMTGHDSKISFTK